jgi:cytochrome P450
VDPADDFLSLLVTAEIDGEGLTEEEVFGFCRNLFPAGIDTSTNSFGSLIHTVLHDEAVRELARRGAPEREAIVQELLRWQPPLALVPRRCVADVTLGAYEIAEGDNLMLSIASANSDPAEFPDPRTFDVSRPNKSLAFSHGEHFCIGSHMARRVLESGLETLLRRFPEMAVCAERPSEIVHGTLRGPRELWVRRGHAA